MSRVINKRLGDILNFKRGYDLPSYNRVDGPYPIISSSGISGYHSDYKKEGEGLVTGRTGTLGEVYYIDGKYWPHNTSLYVTDFKGNYPKYLYFLLKCLGNLQTADKSTVPGVNRNDLHEIIVPYLNPIYQRPIADFLFNIEKKIELNNRINAELEAMAKIIYDYWFVQFDFPVSPLGEMSAKGGQRGYKTSGGKMIWNDELKREIPEGWEVKQLCTVASITTGKLDSNAETVNGMYPFFTCAAEPIRTDTFSFNENAILIAGNNASGNFHINRYSGKFNAYQRTYIVTAKEKFNLEYLYQVLKIATKDFKQRGNGSQTKFLTIGMLNEIKVFDESSLIEKYNDIVSPLYERQVLLKSENQQLTELRDWLLPMLMNGQVKVKEAEEMLRLAAEGEADYKKIKK